MWTEITRPQYDREGRRYASDATDVEWALNDFPPVSTVRRYFYDWRDRGLLRSINHHLVLVARAAMGREASPSAGVILNHVQDQPERQDHRKRRDCGL